MRTQYICKSNERREAVRSARTPDNKPILNGMDFLEVDPSDQKHLTIRFIHNLPGAPTAPQVPPPPAPQLTADNIRIEGGARVKDVRVAQIVRQGNNELVLTVDAPGDFSIYTLRLVTSGNDPAPPRGFDPQLASIEFSFKVECFNEFDCEQTKYCPPEWTPPPEINYLAKDYGSFRQVMLDRMAVLMPGWTERNPADLGITLVELLAYTADYLSYQQDAVATEAYLGTARRRISVRRHARLVDYFMHDGSNARAWVQVRVRQDVTQAPTSPGDPPSPPRLPMGTQILTRVPRLANVLDPLNHPVINQAVANGAEVFETMAPLPELYKQHNDILFYTWGESDCCLPKGATRATLLGIYSRLKKGDVLIFKEARGPITGETEDADPTRRHAVRLTSDPVIKDRDNNPLTDPLNGELITEIEWHVEDALPFPFCISARADAEHGGNEISNLSIALGNIVLADHGRTIEAAESLGSVPPPTLKRVAAPSSSQTTAFTGAGSAYLVTEEEAESDSAQTIVPPRFRPRLKQSPLCFAAPYPFEEKEQSVASARSALNWEMRNAQPVIELESTFESDPPVKWKPKRDLLNSGEDAEEFVVEVEDEGSAFIRFGDDNNGKRPASGTAFSATYRVGNGTRGNIGAEALAHIISSIPDIASVTNPLPAHGGIEPESLERVRQNAPVAFRTQERAVTTLDYAEVAVRHAGIQRAAATVRWTGSWNTIFLTVDRLGGARVDDEFETEIRRHVEKYRMAGHDLEIDEPRLVAVELEMEVCVKTDYFRSEVKRALLEVFSNRVLPDGGRGLFHPDNFSFGQSIYLSALYAAAERVEGVASVQIKTLQRQGNPSLEALEKGELAMSRLEIAMLENDPNFPHHGIFRLTVEGGK